MSDLYDDITTSAAIAAAISFEMKANKKVLVLGEDIAIYGGVFGATEGLLQEFGADRVRDMPIAEMSFTGMGVGLAMAGYRPIVEIMFADFVGSCLDQVYNAMAKIPYMSGGNTPIPMVIKTAGGCIGAAAQHSQCLWGTFAHLPGMKVVVPSCPYTAKGLMTAAIRSEDPVVFIEHKALMRRKNSAFQAYVKVPKEAYEISIGRARTLRSGKDLTVVSLANSVQDAMAAAEELMDEGIETEIIDLLSVVPLDIDTIIASVSKTGRLLIVDEDYRSFGVSGEIIALLHEKLGPSSLPHIRRLATPDIPIPAAKSLERAAIPSIRDIVMNAKEIIVA